jgi:SNF2 family DNA or RNA helicase
MKTRNLMKAMGLIMLTGILVTFLYIDFYNNKSNELSDSPRKISYDAIHESSFNRINKLIAAENNPGSTVFINKLRKEMLDLRITKEIYQHTSKQSTQKVPVYPLVTLWGAIALVSFILLRSKELKDKSINLSYEKMLDHLEMSYSQDHKKENKTFDDLELVKEFRSTANEEI